MESPFHAVGISNKIDAFFTSFQNAFGTHCLQDPGKLSGAHMHKPGQVCQIPQLAAHAGGLDISHQLLTQRQPACGGGGITELFRQRPANIPQKGIVTEKLFPVFRKRKSKRVKEILQYLHDHDYDGYVSTEYEGNRWTLPGRPTLEKEQVLLHQQYIRKCLREIQG